VDHVHVSGQKHFQTHCAPNIHVNGTHIQVVYMAGCLETAETNCAVSRFRGNYFCMTAVLIFKVDVYKPSVLLEFVDLSTFLQVTLPIICY
jgi:hypothetical protein